MKNCLLLTCATLIFLQQPCALAQSTDAAGTLHAKPAITVQHSTQKSATSSARESFTASTPAVTDLKRPQTSTLSNREKLNTFRAHPSSSASASDDPWSNNATVASPWTSPDYSAPQTSQP
ncbi:hypothetical protein [Paraburkholderia saeva]|uniref:Uncharacterized protein n=1 Tax=Paraburkholderia saeva TaxID=2777537 RepID=A0A9N8RVW3_9BURK|nr:hypothetical protein [Paraburkholderia saeva]CAG4894538.1 hypothetical protein LMG31841_01934 [Paraburkholderia saeva]